jgi:hypothetical protein
LKKQKKILSTLFKVLIGVASFGIIYMRLRSDLTPGRVEMIGQAISSWRSIALLVLCLLMIPINWGIESYKWQLITAPVERVSYRTATKSVYSGVCLGNLAPARATEFVAKIIYFHIRSRPQVTVLHFLSGMFQLAITVLAGFAAMFIHVRNIVGSAGWILYTTASIGGLFLLALILAVYKVDPVLHYLSGKISKDKALETFHYHFSRRLLLQMTGYSMLRYLVFYTQFALLLSIFIPFGLDLHILAGIALYFLVTSLIPMISVFEAAIRAAIALVVFKDSGISATALALSSVLLWLVNIILPSMVGYYFLLRQNFNFKLFRASR